MNIYWLIASLLLLTLSIYLSVVSIKNKNTVEIIFIIPYNILVLILIYALSISSYVQFGFTHLTFTITCIYSGFILAHYIKSASVEKTVEYIFSAVYFLMLIDRFFIYPGSIYYKLPLNICNIATVFIMLRPVYKNKLIDAYIICFGLLGAITNTFIGLEYSASISFFSPVTFASNFDHNLFYTYIIYRLLKEKVSFKSADILTLTKYLIPSYIIFIFTNEIYKYNYFFTSRYSNPVVFLYDFFPTFIIKLFGYNFEINIIYYIFCISSCLAVLYGMILLIKKLQEKQTTKFTSFFNSDTLEISKTSISI